MEEPQQEQKRGRGRPKVVSDLQRKIQRSIISINYYERHREQVIDTKIKEYYTRKYSNVDWSDNGIENFRMAIRTRGRPRKYQ